MKDFNPIERIIELCKERNWTYYQLSKASGIAYSTLNTMLHKNNMPSLSTLNKLCNGFGISITEFFESDKNSAGLTEDQALCLKLYTALPIQDKKLVIAYLKGLSKQL